MCCYQNLPPISDFSPLIFLQVMDPDSDIMKKLRHKSHDSDYSNAQDTKEMEVSNKKARKESPCSTNKTIIHNEKLQSF